MSQDHCIAEDMRSLPAALHSTGLTVAVEPGRNLVLFDTTINEPIELEITTGTEIVKENGQTSVTVFDRSGDE